MEKDDSSDAPVWHLYMIETAAGAWYTGVTTDVERRFHEHSRGLGAKALRGKGPLRLVYRQMVGSHGEALRLEARVKRLSAANKRLWVAQHRN